MWPVCPPVANTEPSALNAMSRMPPGHPCNRANGSGFLLVAVGSRTKVNPNHALQASPLEVLTVLSASGAKFKVLLEPDPSQALSTDTTGVALSDLLPIR